MSVTPYLGPGVFGASEQPLSIWCDAAPCRARYCITGRVLPLWFQEGRVPPGWRTHTEDGKRRDWCPNHKHEATALTGR